MLKAKFLFFVSKSNSQLCGTQAGTLRISRIRILRVCNYSWMSWKSIVFRRVMVAFQGSDYHLGAVYIVSVFQFIRIYIVFYISILKLLNSSFLILFAINNSMCTCYTIFDGNEQIFNCSFSGGIVFKDCLCI